MTDTNSGQRVSASASWVISICFWGGLGAAASLWALIVLSPRWMEIDHSQAAYARNAQILLDLQRENARLHQVAQALEFDADYRARVAARELRVSMPGELKIASEFLQDFSRETSAASPSKSSPAAVCRCSPIVELMATSTPVRRRCIAATMVLTLLTFLCFNEKFLNGGLRRAVRGFSSALGNRYALAATDPVTKD